jgi:ornithine cyclodeaminase/alanine dehydrogenase-like protein (mu-crystallin family)
LTQLALMPIADQSRQQSSEESPGTLILTGADVRAVLGMEECIAAVQQAHALHAAGEASTGSLGLHVDGGGFHVKVAAARLGRPYFVAKTNANFPDNPVLRSLPTIQGVIVLCDATDGRLLALLDSIEVTALRTGAATAVAARFLARPDSSVVTIVGCGTQGRTQLRALARVLPLERAYAVDRSEAAARTFAAEMTAELDLAVTTARDLTRATRVSDVCVTCTPSRRPLLGRDDVRSGAFVAAVGADHPEKQELDPDLFRGAVVVADVLDQCLEFGDLHHAVAAGALTRDDVHGELGQVVTGARRLSGSETATVIFDSTGTALQDVAAAAIAYERALGSGGGRAVRLAGSAASDS